MFEGVESTNWFVQKSIILGSESHKKSCFSRQGKYLYFSWNLYLFYVMTFCFSNEHQFFVQCQFFKRTLFFMCVRRAAFFIYYLFFSSTSLMIFPSLFINIRYCTFFTQAMLYHNSEKLSSCSTLILNTFQVVKIQFDFLL